ncbi:hypothetical protein ACFLQ2_02995 [archaeon]
MAIHEEPIQNHEERHKPGVLMENDLVDAPLKVNKRLDLIAKHLNFNERISPVIDEMRDDMPWAKGLFPDGHDEVYRVLKEYNLPGIESEEDSLAAATTREADQEAHEILNRQLLCVDQAGEQLMDIRNGVGARKEPADKLVDFDLDDLIENLREYQAHLENIKSLLPPQDKKGRIMGAHTSFNTLVTNIKDLSKSVNGIKLSENHRIIYNGLLSHPLLGIASADERLQVVADDLKQAKDRAQSEKMEQIRQTVGGKPGAEEVKEPSSRVAQRTAMAETIKEQSRLVKKLRDQFSEFEEMDDYLEHLKIVAAIVKPK